MPGGRASALCLTPAEPELSSLVTLASQNPQAALAKAKAGIARAEATGKPVRTIAWLHAIEADAYWQLSDTPGGKKASEAGLALPIAKTDPVYVQLLIQNVFRDFRAETFRASAPVLTAARARFRKGSDEDICLQATLGDAQRLSGDFQSAAPNLVSAYRLSQSAGRERQHIYAGYALALFMRSAGDYDRALQLLAERTAWNRKMRYDFLLSGDYFVAGRFLRLAGRNEEALVKLDRAVAYGQQFGDAYGVPYYMLEQCAALTAMNKLPQARKLCEDAARTFRTMDSDMLSEVDVVLADIAMRDDGPAKALTLLDRALSPTAGKSASFSEGKAYLLRSRAHAALGQISAAYRDLTEYIRINDDKVRNERARQIVSREAELEAERQIAQNRVLEQRLETARLQARDQIAKAVIILSVAVAIILCLIAIIFLTRRTKRLLERAANIDAMTGLLNRRSLAGQGKAACAAAARTGQPLSIAIIDIDHFKQVNDNHGHAMGDEVLKRLAMVMQDSVRGSDIIGRWGGEEFLLILPNSSPDAALIVLERMRQSALDIRLPSHDDIIVSFSAGISALASVDESLDAIVNRADVALYAAKKNGRRQSLCWDESMAATGTDMKART